MLIFAYVTIADENVQRQGKVGGLVETGDFMFAMTVILSNCKIFFNANTIDWGLVTTVFGSIIVYLAAHLIISETQLFVTEDQFGSIEHVVQYPAVWLALLFFICLFGLLDTGIDKLRKYLKLRRVAKLEAEELQRKLDDLKDKNQVWERQATYRRKYHLLILNLISNYVCICVLDRGFAFA